MNYTNRQLLQLKEVETGRLKAQKAHGFYDEVDEYRLQVKTQQLAKASEKYSEPFNPDSWTGKELTDHAMQENYDQSVYIAGMRKKFLQQAEIIAEKENELQWCHEQIKALKKDLDFEKQAAELWRLRCINEAGKVTTVDVVLKAPQVIDVKALEDAIGKMDKRFKNDARNF